MKRCESLVPDRRSFLGKCLMTSTVLCLGGCAVTRALAQAAGDDEAKAMVKHKFQKDAGLTYEDIMRFSYSSSFIPIMRILSERVGMDALEAAASEAITRRTAEMVPRLPNRELGTLAGFFKSPSPIMANALTFEVVEDTDEAFEIEVTECLWAKTFIESDAADLGHHCICQGDFASARAFNPDIELVRDKTLMRGDDCCNHRYVVRV